MKWFVSATNTEGTYHYGPFDSKHDAEVHAALWLSDLRYTLYHNHMTTEEIYQAIKSGRKQW